MQRGAQPPIFASATLRWPVLLFSHGLTGSPISSSYLTALTALASYGYVVVAPFHGDSRFADVKIENLADGFYAALHLRSYVEMQAMRPLSLARALDVVLDHPQLRDRVDPGHVGGFGGSLGGEGLLLQAGARLTDQVEPDVLPGEYRYHLLLVTPRTRRAEFNGRLELIVTLTDGGQNAMMSFPEPGDAGASEFRLAFKYFRRVEGTFRVNPKAKVENVQVRVYETGSNQPRATHTVTM